MSSALRALIVEHNGMMDEIEAELVRLLAVKGAYDATDPWYVRLWRWLNAPHYWWG